MIFSLWAIQDQTSVYSSVPSSEELSYKLRIWIFTCLFFRSVDLSAKIFSINRPRL